MTVNLPQPLSGSQLLGVKPKAPAATVPTNTLPPSQQLHPQSTQQLHPQTVVKPPTTQSAAELGKNITQTPTAQIQSKLGISADGQYGPQTTKAVKDYQQANGLKVDGIVGPFTLAKLMGGTQSGSGTPPNGGSSSNGYTYDPGMGTPPSSATPTESPKYTPEDTGLYGKMVADLATRSTQSGDDYKAAIAEANRVGEEQSKLAGDYAKKTNNIAGTAGFLTQQAGLQGQLNNQYNTVQGALSSQAASANSRISGANSQQGLLQQALSSAAGYAAPQQVSPTNVPFNPTSGTYGQPAAGAYGQGGLAGVGALLQGQTSGANLQQKITDIDSQSTSVNNNFSRAINYGTSAGLDNSSSIIAGLQRHYANTIQANQAVTGFTQAMNDLNAQLQSLGLSPVDINKITPATLAQAQTAVKNKLANDKANYQSTLSQLQGSSSGNSGGAPNPWH